MNRIYTLLKYIQNVLEERKILRNQQNMTSFLLISKSGSQFFIQTKYL